MADDVKIEVRAPGARQAQRDLRGVAAAEGKVGAAGKAAGRDLKKGSDDGREAMDRLGQSVGVNTRIFTSWHLAAVTGLVALVAGFRKAVEYVRQINREMREGYREFVDLTRQPGTGALADIRGETAAATADWMRRMAQEYTISPEAAREAAFGIESGLTGALGGEATREIGRAAFQTMRVTRASGRTLASLATAAYEAGVARRPEDFRAFFAKTHRYAKESAVSLEQLGQIAARLLPMAVSAGIDPDYFLAMVAAMSFRIPEASRLATTIERLLRAAGTKGPALEEYAAQMGRQVADLSAVEVMQFQARAIAAGRTPREREIIGERLGLAGEVVTSYAAAFDPRVIQRLRGLTGTAGPGTWGGTIGGPYAAIRAERESQYYAARMGAERAKHEAGREQAIFAIIEEDAKAEVLRKMGRGEEIPDVWETLPGGRERAVRATIAKMLYSRLQELFGTKGLTQEQRRQIDAALEDVSARWEDYKTFGLWEPQMLGAARVVQQYQGGTHFHTNERRDAAGRPVAPMAP